ncbi:hypothetical protein, partial [Arsenicicoccus sp. UBA2120]|uniref:hypothetical protein n=2 Tax=Arsenicicoccus TaxID=267408 RepID=UPI00257C4FBB
MPIPITTAVLGVAAVVAFVLSAQQPAGHGGGDRAVAGQPRRGVPGPERCTSRSARSCDTLRASPAAFAACAPRPNDAR